jgi:hypothetical protein
MVIITQLQPDRQSAHLEKNYVKIILENGVNVVSVKFVNDNNEIIINDIFNNGNLCIAQITKYIEPGKYLVSVLYNNEFSNELEYTCYPHVDPLLDTSIAFSKNKVKINGYGFNDRTNVIAKFDDNFQNVHCDFINERELLCYVEKYDCISNNITLSFKVNNILAPGVVQLTYEDPIITAISASLFVNHYSEISIQGKNFGNDTNNIAIFIGNHVCNKVKIISCENNQIVCQICSDSEIGKNKFHIQVYNIQSNDCDIVIAPHISKLSDETINIRNVNKKITIYGNGFANDSKVYCNSICNNNIEQMSSNEISFFLENNTNCGDINIIVDTGGFKSNNVILKINEYHVEKLSKNTVFIDEITNITIFGSNLNGVMQIVIETEQGEKTMDVVIENKSETEIEFEMPVLHFIGTYYLYIIKNDLCSKKCKFSSIPRVVKCFPNIFPICHDRNSAEIVTSFFKLKGKQAIENMKLELFSKNYSKGIKPIIELIDYANEISTFAFNIREHDYIDILNVYLYINDNEIKTNDILFITDITDIFPKQIVVNNDYNMVLYGNGFDDCMKININGTPLKYTLSYHENAACINLESARFHSAGFNDIEITNQDNVKFNISIFAEPVLKNIEYIIDDLISKNVFYINGNGFSKNMNAKVIINNIECSWSFISSDKIVVNLTNFAHVNDGNRLSIIFKPPNDEMTICDSKYILPMYNNDILWCEDIIQFPFVIHTHQIYGLCNNENIITIGGYGFDEFTEFKINEKRISNIKYIHDTNTIRLTIPNENAPKKYEISAVSVDDSRISNQLIYYTIPALLNLSNVTGPIHGGNHITIDGIGLLGNVDKLWFGNAHIEFNYDNQTRINCKIPENVIKRCDTVDVYIETVEGFYSNKLSYTYLPCIEKLSTNSGNISGNYELSLYGSGFLDCNQLKFGEHIISTFTEHSNDKITIIVPKLCAEHYNADIQLSNNRNSTISSNSMSFMYIFPKISHIEPSSGFIRGNDKICMYGEGFSKDLSLTIDNKEIDFVCANDNNIYFHTQPRETSNEVDVNVICNNKKSNSLNFRYKSQMINHINPSEGSVTGGYKCSIHGEGFLSENVQLLCGDIYILKNDFLKHSDETIEFLMPANKCACEVNVYVIINGLISENYKKFSYMAHIKSLSVENCFVNTKIPVIIYGEGFTNSSVVKLGTTIVKNTTFDEKNNSITFITPIISLSQSMPVTVITNNSNSNSILFTIKPIIKTINPQPWSAEDVGFFYVVGEGFSSMSLGCIIGMDNESKIIEPIKSSSSNLVFAMPYIKNSGNITIAIGNQICNENDWVAKKIIIYPKILKLSESHGPIIGGNQIEITGKGFNSTSKICIDDSEYVSESETEYVNENLMLIKIPSSNSLKEIKLSVQYNNINSNYVTYTYCPVIKSIKPNFASIKGGTNAIIIGEGIDNNSIIYFNNKPCENMNLGYNELTKELSVAIPQHFEVENILVKVVTSGVESNGLKFFYTPIIDNISLNRSYVTKKEIVTITGDGFGTNTAIKLGEKFLESSNILKISNNNIQFQLPVINEQCVKELRIFSNSIPSAITKLIVFSAEFTSISPNYCPIAGGIDISIHGNGFNNEIKLFFNEINVDYTLISNTEIIVKMPKNIGMVGTNKINLICNKYATQLSTNVICYPSILYSTQKYNHTSKKATITLYVIGFLSSSTINFGDVLIKNHSHTENTVKFEIDENNIHLDKNPVPIFITTNKLKSRDKIFYNNAPHIIVNDKVNVPINDVEPIVLYGYGFDEANTYIIMDDYGKKIVPFFITSNCIKFQAPNMEKAFKTKLYVVSNEIKTKPIDITFCPSIYSASDTICNIGEEIKLKLYGDGFDEKNTNVLINNDKYAINKFINNKIIEIKLPSIHKCGMIDIYVDVGNIISCSSLKFKVRPVILSFNCDYSNNRGTIEICGMGFKSITSVVFIHEGESYEISKIKYGKNSNENSTMNVLYETISVNYEEISFYKDMIEKNLENITLDIIIKNSEIESIPYKWIIKNSKYNVNYEAEVIKAINICNHYLESNYVSNNYHYIKAYSDNLASTISKLIMQICELPEMYSDKNAEQILINGFNEEYRDIINNKMVYNVILQMIKILLYMLANGIIYENISINIDSPLLIYAKENTRDTEIDYLFQEYIDFKSYKLYNILYAHELSQCIQYKIIDNDIEFKFNEEILNNICDNFDRLFIHKKFILCNNNGRFCGSEVTSKEGTIAELFAYKIASSITGMPEAEIAIIDVENIKSKIVNYENSSEITLGMQLKNILTNDTVLRSLYDQIKRNDMDRFHKSNNIFEQMPFKCGDKLKLKLLVSCKIKYINNDLNGINKNELIYKSCDPDIYEKNKPIEYLLNNSATEIRATNDYYEITLG